MVVAVFLRWLLRRFYDGCCGVFTMVVAVLIFNHFACFQPQFWEADVSRDVCMFACEGLW